MTGSGQEKIVLLIQGFIEHIVFHNETNGYTVLNLETEDDTIVCVGNCHGISEGESIEADGEYVEHPVYGKQFKITSLKVVVPTDVVGIERYLQSGAIPGIGKAIATRIIKAFGDRTIDIIEKEPERLAEVKGISLRKAKEIAEVTEKKRDLRNAMIFLAGYGVSNNLAVKIYNRYEDALYGIIKENPYKLFEDIEGVGFKTADDIAAKIGLSFDSDYRITCGVVYTLMCAAQDGNCYLPKEKLLEEASQILGVSSQRIEELIPNMVMDKKIVVKKEKIFAPMFYYSELNSARMLRELNVYIPEASTGEDALISAKLKRIESRLGMETDEDQLEAVKQSIKNGLFIISGGPGTGKTTIINILIKYFEEEGLEVSLAAPTGRAAKRMSEATGYEAKTIHRLLELTNSLEESGQKAKFNRDANNPLESDVIIIDEMSMVEIMLFNSLLKAIIPGTRLIMVGDVNQLPSVGPGQVLKDLIDSGAYPSVKLNRIYRQSATSDIVLNAHKIKEGSPIKADNKSQDFFFLERNDINVIYKHMIMLIKEKLPKYVEATPFDIQVLTPMKKGALGCESLNSILQEHLNPPSPSKREITGKNCIFREGDKVMQIKNNYQLEWQTLSEYGVLIDSGVGVFNGDMGVIKKIHEAASVVTVVFDDMREVEYSLALLEELELAYAITIHKSQGSEYPAVVMPLLGGPRMLLNRNLLYTAVTRAKKSVVILGSKQTVSNMIDNVSDFQRYTALPERIREQEELSEGEWI
ncbi:MAG: ATP-dependent RecD-like DNA helicase [Lachnospiraceae bacterium]|nr:ATP-dependent RecD-like DNA helicase [Lachnospiraceae bacterium]